MENYKWIVVKSTFTYLRRCPADWDAGNVNFLMNESSSCADNRVSELAEIVEAVGEKGPCMCSYHEGQYLRDATEEDLELMPHKPPKP